MTTRFDEVGPVIAVASRSFSATPILRNELEHYFEQVRYNDSGATLFGDDLVDFSRHADALIVGLERIDEALLDALPNLVFISKYGVGLNNVDIAACRSRGVSVLHSPGVNSYSVSELTLSSAIQLLHRTPESQDSLRNLRWEQPRGRDLRGATIGIIGCGHVGKQLVRLLAPFNCQLLVFDKVYDNEFNAKWGIGQVTLEELLSKSDVITIHLPLDESTRGLISRSKISLIKPGAVLLNYARGGILDEDAIAEKLNQGLIGGVAIDVYMSEPAIDSPLIGMPMVLATSHIGGSTNEAIMAMGRAAITQLVNAYRKT